MFLNPKYIKNSAREQGAALVTVVALMAVTAVVGVAITASLVTANGHSTSTRANAQARAAADAGIDVAFARIAAGNYICTAPAVAGGPTYSATVVYKSSTGTNLTCSGATVSGTPASAVITSIGQSTNKATVGTRGNSHTIRAAVTLTPSAAAATLDKAVFSESGFTITNDAGVLESTAGAKDAHVYSNGAITCKTQVATQGTLYSQGSIVMENNCRASGDVWAAGTVDFSSQAIAYKNVYAAGGAANLDTGHVDGSVIADGKIEILNGSGKMACPGVAATYSVCGSIVALDGNIKLNDGGSVGGSAYAEGTVHLEDHNSSVAVAYDVVSTTGSLENNDSSQGGKVTGKVRVAGNIGGQASLIGNKAGSCQGTADADFAKCVGAVTFPAPNPAVTLPAGLGYPSTTSVNAPAREQMPKMNSGTSDLAQWTSAGWTIVTYNAASASAAGKTSCQQAKDYVAAPHTAKTLVVVRDCTTPISWDNATLTLSGDLAIMSNSGFDSNNNFTIKSNNTTVRSLMFIVPSDAQYITWNAVGGTSPTQYTAACGSRPSGVADIRLDNTAFTSVSSFLYTPCVLELKNSVSGFTGQLYAGSVTFPPNSDFKFKKFTVPGATGAAGPVVATITSRADVG